ncbi:putative beta-arabinofuranosyltransferase RAY1 [Helianthus annuus]|nr:putative beta-arabinofuranosyltransferase RAY1 [Helianthus annuus]
MIEYLIVSHNHFQNTHLSHSKSCLSSVSCRTLFRMEDWKFVMIEKKIILAWNNKDFHNIGVINEALSSNFRFVFDASSTISSFFVNNLDLDPTTEARKWENVGNSHLEALYGSLYYHEARYSNMIKLFKCNGHYYFGSTTENYYLGRFGLFSISNGSNGPKLMFEEYNLKII